MSPSYDGGVSTLSEAVAPSADVDSCSTTKEEAQASTPCGDRCATSFKEGRELVSTQAIDDASSSPSSFLTHRRASPSGTQRQA